MVSQWLPSLDVTVMSLLYGTVIEKEMWSILAFSSARRAPA
jgi:hypothetical protein